MDAKLFPFLFGLLAAWLALATVVATPLFAGDRPDRSAGEVASAAPHAPATPRLARLYQIQSETQFTDVKVSRSDTPAYNLPIAVDRDTVVLRPAEETAVRYRIVGRRYVYESADAGGEMQVGTPALVATRTEAGRVEILTVTPERLTLLRPLAALEGYVLTIARFIGERAVGTDPATSRKEANASRPTPP